MKSYIEVHASRSSEPMLIDIDVVKLVYPVTSVRDPSSIEGPAETVIQMSYAFESSCVSVLEKYDVVKAMCDSALKALHANQ